METRPDGLACRFEKSVIAEPTVGDDQNSGHGKGYGQPGEHFDGLGEFGLKRNGLTTFLGVWASLFNRGLGQIKTECEGQTGPASLDRFQEAQGDDVLRPRIFGLVGLGGVIEEGGTSVDVPTSFWIDEIIQKQHQSVLGERLRNRPPEDEPQSVPRQFG